MLFARQVFTILLAVTFAASLFGVARAQEPAQPPSQTPPSSQPAQPSQPAEPSPPSQGQPSQPSQGQPSQGQPSQGQPAQGQDPFGEEVQVAAKTIIFFKGNANWDAAYETLIDSFKTVYGFLQKEGIKPAGPPMTIYTATNDTGFEFRAAVPIAEAMANPPKGDIEMGQSPSGKMLKFVHRGSYDAMDTTYEAITNYLDTKQLEAQDTFIEEYLTDPLATPEDELVINVLVPIK
jgi:effector-binding domain-containing protein